MDHATVSLPLEASLDERDGLYLRRAIAMADRARQRGNRPFGALIVAAAGAIASAFHWFGSSSSAFFTSSIGLPAILRPCAIASASLRIAA